MRDEGGVGATEAERESAAAHLRAMKLKIQGKLEQETKARLIKEGLAEAEKSEGKETMRKKEPVAEKGGRRHGGGARLALAGWRRSFI